MTRDPAGYRSAVHHLAWLCVEDIPLEGLPDPDDGEHPVWCLDRVSADTADRAGAEDDHAHVLAYLTAALDLVNLAMADMPSVRVQGLLGDLGDRIDVVRASAARSLRSKSAAATRRSA